LGGLGIGTWNWSLGRDWSILPETYEMMRWIVR
jgi:hypothetical protein